MSEPSDVLYEERDGIAIITLNRPAKKNTLTETVVALMADCVDRANRSPVVAAIVLRGAGDTFTAGYDLTDGKHWDMPYESNNAITQRLAADTQQDTPPQWDPIKDYQFMGNNVRRFMSIWESPKPVLGEIKGWAIGGATDLVLCCDLLFMADTAHIGYAPSRIYGTPTTMMWIYRLGLEHAKQFLLTGRAIDAATAHRIGLVSQVVPEAELASTIEAEAMRFQHIPGNQLALNKLLINQAFENMGLRTTQMMGTLFDGITRHTQEARQWQRSFADKGFRQVIRERDAPWQDYGEGKSKQKPEDEAKGL